MQQPSLAGRINLSLFTHHISFAVQPVPGEEVVVSAGSYPQGFLKGFEEGCNFVIIFLPHYFQQHNFSAGDGGAVDLVPRSHLNHYGSSARW